jgi:hypothetical protein
VDQGANNEGRESHAEGHHQSPSQLEAKEKHAEAGHPVDDEAHGGEYAYGRSDADEPASNKGA